MRSSLAQPPVEGQWLGIYWGEVGASCSLTVLGAWLDTRGLPLLGESCGRGGWGTALQGWDFTLGEKIYLLPLGKWQRKRAAGLSYPSKEIRLKSPTFDLL